MSAVIEAPVELVEAVASLRIPSRMDRRMQDLMDHNTEGSLSADGRTELEALVEFSENIALLRTRALKLLGRKPA